MKKAVFLFLSLGLCFSFTSKLTAQEKPQKEAKLLAEEEEGPLMYKFEPDYMTTQELRREEINFKKTLIDSLDISENKRQKLIRDLYSNKGSKRLDKILLTHTVFEEEAEEKFRKK